MEEVSRDVLVTPLTVPRLGWDFQDRGAGSRADRPVMGIPIISSDH